MPEQKGENVSSNPSPANSGASTGERVKSSTNEHVEGRVYSELKGKSNDETDYSGIAVGAAVLGGVAAVGGCIAGSTTVAAIGFAATAAASAYLIIKNGGV